MAAFSLSHWYSLCELRSTFAITVNQNNRVAYFQRVAWRPSEIGQGPCLLPWSMVQVPYLGMVLGRATGDMSKIQMWLWNHWCWSDGSIATVPQQPQTAHHVPSQTFPLVRSCLTPPAISMFIPILYMCFSFCYSEAELCIYPCWIAFYSHPLIISVCSDLVFWCICYSSQFSINCKFN